VAIWATAFYSGLRLGELQALRWEDVDLGQGMINVRRSWDQQEGVIEPKTRNGKRRIAIAPPLRAYLVAHRIRKSPNDNSEYVFGRPNGEPFSPSSIHQRAARAWKGMEWYTPHEARHTFGTLVWDSMIQAGHANPKRLQMLMGHSDLETTMNRYVKDSLDAETMAAEDFALYLSERDFRSTDTTSD
jgi:integrase